MWNFEFASGSRFGDARSYDPRSGAGWAEAVTDFDRATTPEAIRIAFAVEKDIPHAVEHVSTGDGSSHSRVITPSETKLTLLDASGSANIDSVCLTPSANFVLISHLAASNMIVRRYSKDWKYLDEFEVPSSPQNGAAVYGENFIAVSANRIGVCFNQNNSDGIYRLALFDLNGEHQTTIAFPDTDIVGWFFSVNDTFTISRKEVNGAGAPDTHTIYEFSETGVELSFKTWTGNTDYCESYGVTNVDYLYEWRRTHSSATEYVTEIIVYDRSVTRDADGVITDITYSAASATLTPAGGTDTTYDFKGLAFDYDPAPLP